MVSQPFSAGVIGGVPLTDLVSTANSVSSGISFVSTTNRYIVGVAENCGCHLGWGSSWTRCTGI